MKYAHVLCLLLSATFLTACDAVFSVMPDSMRPAPVSECLWTEEILFREDTKDWLMGLDWPTTAYADFNQIGDHNELYRTYCN